MRPTSCTATHGIPVTHLDADAARARVASPRYLAGFLDPTVGLVDPGRLVWGLADAAERLGVRVHEDTTVTGFDREERRRSSCAPSGGVCAPTASSSGPAPSAGCSGGSPCGPFPSTTTSS